MTDADEKRGDQLPRFRSASELVALSELLYRGIFAAGLVVGSIVTSYALLLTLLQPAGSRQPGVASCIVLLAGQLAALHWRFAVYRALRRHPSIIAVPALGVGLAAALAGTHNEQFFYVLTLLIGVSGIAVSLRATAFAATVAAVGVMAPYLAYGSGPWGIAIGAVLVPPIFWMLVEYLARFMLDLHQLMTETYGRWPRPGGAERRSARTFAAASPRGVDRVPGELSERAFSLHDWEVQQPRVRRILNRHGAKMSARQAQAVFYCCDGLGDREIAEAMSIGVPQVRRYLSQARARTGSSTREQMAAWAVCNGLIP